MSYYVIVGVGQHPRPKKGPYKTFRLAVTAIEAFRRKHGHMADTFLQAASCRVYEYALLRDARDADISDMNIIASYSV